MTFTLCSSHSIVAKAGEAANVEAQSSSALLEQFSLEAEAEINLRARYDFVSNWGSISGVASGAIASACSDLAAIKLVGYDMSGYTTLGYAEDTINLLNNNATKILNEIKEDKERTFAIGGKTGAS